MTQEARNEQEMENTQPVEPELEKAQADNEPMDMTEPVVEEIEAAEASAQADLEQQLQQEREKAQGLLDELKRERASFINYRRRIEQEKESWSREATASLIYNLLSVLDDFERAKKAIPEEFKGSPWVEGLLLVERKLFSTLELAGLKPIEAVGKPFDPNIHEAVSTEPVEGVEHGTVVEEYRKGYMLGDRVLRPSMVKVAQ